MTNTHITRSDLVPQDMDNGGWRNRQLPFSIYDVAVSSADGKQTDILSSRKGKVTLLFNVAAGCGNIPQHSVIEELNQKYKNEPDFDIIAIVVDDFVCHGYAEFQDGIQAYIDKNGLDLTPGQVAEKYAQEHFGSTYNFSELTNGRFDKHTYDPNYVPGKLKLQEQHPLWWYLTGAYEADLQPNGVPYHYEEIPWSFAEELSEDGHTPIAPNKKGFFPLRGNFEKFLIDRTGTKILRYANGFLLGERNVNGEVFPWIEERYDENGRRFYGPKTEHKSGADYEPVEPGKRWPNKLQRRGIDVSLEIISSDIDAFLSEK